MSTDPFYRMFPAHLGTAKFDDDSTFFLEDLQGHCFMSMDIHTTLAMTEEKSLTANIVFDLDESLGFCMEHL